MPDILTTAANKLATILGRDPQPEATLEATDLLRSIQLLTETVKSQQQQIDDLAAIQTNLSARLTTLDNTFAAKLNELVDAAERRLGELEDNAREMIAQTAAVRELCQEAETFTKWDFERRRLSALARLDQTEAAISEEGKPGAEASGRFQL